MKYIVFSGVNYYASGGANDFIKGFDDIDEASNYASTLIKGDTLYGSIEWWHILDTDTLEIVKQSDEQAHGAN